MKSYITVFLISLLISSCNNNPFKNVDLSDSNVQLIFHSLDNDLFDNTDINKQRIEKLKDKYPQILPLFTTEVIRIGYPEDKGVDSLLKAFVTDTMIIKVKEMVDDKINKQQVNKDIEKAFRYYKYYFNNAVIPTVFTCISGFNQSIIMTDSIMGIGLDKYMGDDCKYYSQLGINAYQQINMKPEKIASDAMYAWIMTNFPFTDYGSQLIDKMIYEGKLLYILDAILPDTPDNLKIGYTPEQIKFCEENEADMWRYLAENKMLFSSDRMDIIRYTGDAPYTSSFSSDSPGRTACWLGWQIVRSYMENNQDITLLVLMSNKDCKQLLNKSKYHPKK